MMDHADSGLFHVLEDAIRLQNADHLGVFASQQAALTPLVSDRRSQQSTPTASQHSQIAHAPAAASLAGVPSIAGEAPPAAVLAAEPSTEKLLVSSALPQHTRPQIELLETHAGVVGVASARPVRAADKVAFQGEEEELPLPPAIAEHLERSDALDLVTLQALATLRLTPEQAADAELDVVTGVHVTDGKMRMMVVEGLQGGVMTGVVLQIMTWAQMDPCPVEGGIPRKVVFNCDVAYEHRLYSSLGANLWMVKLRATLPGLLRTPATFAVGKVRPDCKEGLLRVGRLADLTWGRQLHELNCWPTAAQLKLIDKKFGGELTKGDVLGVEAEDEPVLTSAEVFKGASTIAPSAVGGGTRKSGSGSVAESGVAETAHTAGTSVAGSCSSRKQYGSRAKKQKKKIRYRCADLAPLRIANCLTLVVLVVHRTQGNHPIYILQYRHLQQAELACVCRKQYLPPLDMQNERYELRVAELNAIRASRDIAEHAEAYVRTLQISKAGVRDAWQVWNPQRAMGKLLEAQIASGEITLQVRCAAPPCEEYSNRRNDYQYLSKV